MAYAGKVKFPLNEIVIVDSQTISEIAALVPPGGLSISQIKADTDIADAIGKKHALGADNQELSGL
jgi:hypothetical protein